MTVPLKRLVTGLGFVLLAGSVSGCVATTAELSGPSGESGLAGARPAINPLGER